MEEIVAELTLPGARSSRREPGLGRLGAHVDRELRDAARERAAPRAAARRARGGAAHLRPRRARCLDQPASSSSSTRAVERSEADVDRASSMQARDASASSTNACRSRHRSSRSSRLRPGLEGRGVGRDAVARVPRRASTRSAGCATRRCVSPAATPPRASRPAIEFMLEGLHLVEPPQQAGARGRRALQPRVKIDRLQPLGRHAAGVLARREAGARRALGAADGGAVGATRRSSGCASSASSSAASTCA